MFSNPVNFIDPSGYVVQFGLIFQRVWTGCKWVWKLVARKPSLGISKKGLKHATKHLKEFQKLDPKFTEARLIKLAQKISSNSNNAIKFRGLGNRKAFQQAVSIGGKRVNVRVVGNEAGNIRSISIRP